jgi:hypothetical protein
MNTQFAQIIKDLKDAHDTLYKEAHDLFLPFYQSKNMQGNFPKRSFYIRGITKDISLYDGHNGITVYVKHDVNVQFAHFAQNYGAAGASLAGIKYDKTRNEFEKCLKNAFKAVFPRVSSPNLYSATKAMFNCRNTRIVIDQSFRDDARLNDPQVLSMLLSGYQGFYFTQDQVEFIKEFCLTFQ